MGSYNPYVNNLKRNVRCQIVFEKFGLEYESVDISRVKSLEASSGEGVVSLDSVLSNLFSFETGVDFKKESFAEERVHTTVSVYSSDLSYVANGVKESDLEDQIIYNKTVRPNRAFILNGQVIHNGLFREKDVKMLEEKFKYLKKTVFSNPYE